MPYRRIAFALSLILTHSACQKQDNPSSKILLGESGLIHDVLDLVHTHYADTVDTDKIVAGAVNGALNTLDDFSNYYSEKDYKTLIEILEGQFGGIGAEIRLTKEGLEVIAPLDDGPAFKAGIQRGDFIIAIEGVPITKLSSVEVIQKVHGAPDTFLTLDLLRQGEEIKNLKIKRELMTDIPIKSHLEGRIAYIRLNNFNNQTAEHLKKTIETLNKQLKEKHGGAVSFQGVIVDVRNNPGGTLDQALLVTSLFLDKGAIVNVSGKDSSLNRTFYSQGPDLFKDIPLVILINKGSASASEVVAGALRDHKRAILVGEKTYGKGSVQRIFDMGSKGAVKLTIAYFTTPQGHKIHGKGLEPDIRVEAEKSPAPTAATSYASSPASSKDMKDTKASPYIDYQKQRALDLLQGLSVLNKW